MKTRHFTITPRHIVLVAAGFIVCGFVGYFAYQLLPAFRAPKIVLEMPASDMTAETPNLIFRGRLQDGTRLMVNHDDVYVDGEGNFSQRMWLASGLNTLEIIAANKFGRQSKLTRYIVYNP
ncbi:MAG: hypothetical protein Q8Q39_00570 [bacterium]|nr:hypothetical protein [bacterium]